jgi:transposase-like protein
MHRERSNVPSPMDFKIQAVRLLRESGKSLKEVAEGLGASTNALRALPCRHRIDLVDGAGPQR